jgi:hypothetical protein
LSAADYHNLMMDNIDEINDKRLQALKEIEKDKIQVAKAYNKKLKIEILSSRRLGLEDHYACQYSGS